MKKDVLAKARELMQKEASLPPGVTKEVAEKGWPLYHKIGTTLGVAGLGMSGAALVDSRRSAKADEQRKAIEQKSLTALQKIHEALSIKPTTEADIIKAPIDVKTPRH